MGDRQRPRRRRSSRRTASSRPRSRPRRRSASISPSGEIRTIIWATGFRPDYSWLDVPVLDRKGRSGTTAASSMSPGMYLMGMPFLRRRKSALIDGAGDDARDLSAHLSAYLDGRLPAN